MAGAPAAGGAPAGGAVEGKAASGAPRGASAGDGTAGGMPGGDEAGCEEESVGAGTSAAVATFAAVPNVNATVKLTAMGASGRVHEPRSIVFLPAQPRPSIRVDGNQTQRRRKPQACPSEGTAIGEPGRPRPPGAVRPVAIGLGSATAMP
jgi:hypothetical protein